MPRIFDNIETDLLSALRQTLAKSLRADFCVGYFNLRGWKYLAHDVATWDGSEDNRVRLLVGMPINQERQLAEAYALHQDEFGLDQSARRKLKEAMAKLFRDQLCMGAPTVADERGLKILRDQLLAKQVVVKLHLRFALHAKLYLCHRHDADNPMTAYLGSSNLTYSGLRNQGELNVDVLDHDATGKLSNWFNDRWNDNYSVDITDELAAIIDESWVTPRTPYEIYIKMAYHLSREARSGVANFEIPRAFKGRLFDYQSKAVQIAAHHVEKRNGVVLGDVVGLGKTIMAACVARIFRDRGERPLIIAPPKLMKMWQRYSDEYELDARVISLGNVENLVERVVLHKLVIIDESHNLRNRESARYRHVKAYLEHNESKVILLSATPYNKSYQDLSAQLQLFLDENQDIGVRPDAYINTLPNKEADLTAKHTCTPHCLRAFDFSPFASDWQQLMRLFMVRRTRTFIKKHYTELDPERNRNFLTVYGGDRYYFPNRLPKAIKFEFDQKSELDPYARLFSDRVVDKINSLALPRYGLAEYVASDAGEHASSSELQILQDLGFARRRLMGFCRTNLFKRLESEGSSFLISLRRHALRNLLFAHALENDLPLPIGAQDPALMDTRFSDVAEDAIESNDGTEDWSELRDQGVFDIDNAEPTVQEKLLDVMKQEAAEYYQSLHSEHRRKFKWIKSSLFNPELHKDLLRDAAAIAQILAENPRWDPAKDHKLNALLKLVRETHPDEKVLVFTQFADTARYLHKQLVNAGLTDAEVAIGGHGDLEGVATRFSPRSNGAEGKVKNPIRVLIATDVLSEGQNLQDAFIIVNFDLPWAIIRLVQRAGRVDRIGQVHPDIFCYTFVPMEGVENVIHLRQRVRQRLRENAEVVGTDEAFFDDDDNDHEIVDIYNEKSGIFDGDEDDEDVDLQSRAYQIYQEAIKSDPTLEAKIEKMPNVVWSTKPRATHPPGVITYVRTPEDMDALALVNEKGESITENQGEILAMAACEPNCSVEEPHERHHELVKAGVQLLINRERQSTGALGTQRSTPYRVYQAVKRHIERCQEEHRLYDGNVERAIELMLRSPLKSAARETLSAKLRSRGNDEDIANLVMDLYNEDRLCVPESEIPDQEPQIICSLGLI